MSDIDFKSPYGTYKVKRVPHRKKELLRAWDSADELVLNFLNESKVNLDGGLLVVNDIFASLTVSLHQFAPVSWSDSWISHQAMRQNLVLNEINEHGCKSLDSLHVPKFSVSVLVIKVPKSMALFEYQLLQIKPLLTADSLVIVAGMLKYMPKRVWLLLESIIGKTNTHLAVKKAKLIEVSVDSEIELPLNPYPLTWALENSNLILSNHANVFAREHLDVGTRFFIDHLPHFEEESHVVDLACGNGVLGLLALEKCSTCQVTFLDESYMAIASAKENAKQVESSKDRVKFYCGDGLAPVKKQSADLILCNPPFHQHHSTGETVALSMFSDASKVLKKDGELWVVANRHLDYHRKLSTWFLDVVLVASNKSFVILKAKKPKNTKIRKDKEVIVE